MTAGRTLARNHTTTLALVGIVLVLSLVTGAAFGASDDVLAFFGASAPGLVQGHALVAPLTAALIADGGVALVLALLAIAAFVGVSEKVMGQRRAFFAYVLTGAAGVIGGSLVEAMVVGPDSFRPGQSVLDPLMAVCGTVMAASAFTERMWRRRIRSVGFTILLVLVLYSGTAPDLYRLTAAVAGLLLGIAFTPAPHRFTRIAPSSRHEARTLLAALTFIVAIGPVVTLLAPSPRGPLHTVGHLLDGRATADASACLDMIATAGCLDQLASLRASGPGAILLSLLPLAVLALSAFGMLRGRRVAVWVAVAVLGFLAYLAAFYYGLLPMIPDDSQLRIADPSFGFGAALAVVVPLALAIGLLFALGHFPGRTTAREIRLFWIRVGGAFVATATVYLVGGYLAAEQFEPPVTFLSLLLDLPERYFPIGFLHLRLLEFVPEGPIATALYDWTGAFFWIVVLIASAFAMTGSAGRIGTSDLERVHALLRSGSSGSLAHMATWQGHSYWFAPDDEAAVAYRVVSGVALTTGGPIGPAASREATIRGFVSHCDANGWIPAFYSIDCDLLPAFKSLGWQSATIGDDAVITPETFTLAGGRWKDVRTSVNRAAKLGVTANWTTWDDLPLALRSQVESISEEWIAGRGLPEMGFTLGGVDELADPEVRMMLAVSDSGSVLAATSWMPTYRDGVLVGWTLDFMRRRTDSMNGVVEFLIAETVARAKLEGVEFVSLSAAPLARAVESDEDAPPAEQVLGYVGRRLESLYGFRSLLAFKLKFGPTFRQMAVAYPDPLVLPAIGIALARAYLPSMTVGQAVSIMRAMIRTNDSARRVPEKVPVA